MQVERRVLYNLLRMNWLNDPSIKVKSWQIADYRNLSYKDLFSRLEPLGIFLDKQIALNYCNAVESPEEFVELLLEDRELDSDEQDQVYLLIFEVWRRLMPEKLSHSVFCDELDHQIFLYDQGDSTAAESIQDAIANLQMILDENTDQGTKPTEVFEWVSSGCANDLSSFLYDYISEQIDIQNIAYATELVEGFQEYLKGNKWMDLLRVRLLEYQDPDAVQQPLRKIVQKAIKENSLSYNLEVLAFLSQSGDKGEFNKVVKNSLPLIEKEEDFQDLLAICSDYFRCLDLDQKEDEVQAMLENRLQHSLDEPFNAKDPDLQQLLKIIR